MAVKDLISLGVGAITDLAHAIRFGLSGQAVAQLGSVETATTTRLTATHTTALLTATHTTERI